MLNETVHCIFNVPFQSDFVGCDVGFVWGASLAWPREAGGASFYELT